MSSTREREHFELEDAFKSLQIPELELDLKMFGGSTYSGPAGSAATIQIELSLRNISNVSAMFIYNCASGAAYEVDNTKRVDGIAVRSQDGSVYFEAVANTIIHPNVSRIFGTLAFSIQYHQTTQRHSSMIAASYGWMQRRTATLGRTKLLTN